MRKKRTEISRRERRERREAVLHALRESKGTIPPDVLTALVAAGLVILSQPARTAAPRIRPAGAGLSGESLYAALSWPYRDTLAKLKAGVPVTLDEVADLNLLTVAEAAELMAVSDRTVHALVARGDIAHFRIHARALRIPAGAAVEHLASRLTYPSSTDAEASTPAPADLETRTA
ncbi:helix-turn-helix domain-containing protein [Nonomuraea sp. NPDC001636]|uniref:helix-turn-helix domain-containing protein n=1 Tax=unclassified Nonomuraea TaxID=2593643 RepID=UPI00331AAF01